MKTDLPTIYIEEVTAATDYLMRRSGKFRAFFSRAELEHCMCFAILAAQKAKAAAIEATSSPSVP